jgi:acyl carrier protein
MENTLDIIKDYLKQHMDNLPEALTAESRLDEIGIDSLSLLEFLFELEDKYDINVPEDVPSPKTIGQLIEVIDRYKPAATNE